MTTGLIPIRAAPYGVLADGRPIAMHTLANANGMEVSFLSYGGLIACLKVPDRHGVLADVAPGYDSLAGFVGDPRYFGVLVGRYANRIAGGRFTLDGVEYALPTNDGPNTLHGGARGFNVAVWNVEPFTDGTSVGAVLTHHSPDGDQGFPGALDAEVTYRLTEANELCFEYRARTDRATHVCLMHHSYFNLAGHGSGTALDHELTIAASRYLPVDGHRIPTGEVQDVAGTGFDFRRPREIGCAGAVHGVPPDGFDHNFVLDAGTSLALRLAARLRDPRSGRVLEIATTEPGLQLYSGGRLAGGPRGKDGCEYDAHSVIALETQHFPNSPNVPAFPSTVLRPGDRYLTRTRYRFSAE